MQAAFQRLAAKRIEMGIVSSTAIYVDVGGYFGRVPMNGEEFTIREKLAQEPHVIVKVDPRLLKKLLSGPRLAHWNNADIGSHIEYRRSPDTFERGVYECMNFFHA
jgi:UDP-MurNAc hydroxylase